VCRGSHVASIGGAVVCTGTPDAFAGAQVHRRRNAVPEARRCERLGARGSGRSPQKLPRGVSHHHATTRRERRHTTLCNLITVILHSALAKHTPDSTASTVPANFRGVGRSILAATESTVTSAGALHPRRDGEYRYERRGAPSSPRRRVPLRAPGTELPC
jgi:hypothetical protein